MIKDFIRSFSFRAGAILFLGLSIALITVHIITYEKTISDTYKDIQAIIDAHIDDINHGMTNHGPAYVKDLVATIAGNTRDKYLYISFRNDKNFSGNLHQWPVSESDINDGWREIYISRDNNKPPLHLYIKQITYPNRSRVLVGYNLQRIDQMRATLSRVLLGNIIISFLATLSLSLLLVWLLNRYLKKVNYTFDRVMAGNLKYRMRTRGHIDQFDLLSINLNRMLDWINILIDTAKDSSNALAHDMRTPLSRHRLSLRALSDNPKLPFELRDDVIRAVERVDTLVEMFDNILTISKAESRYGTELFEPVDLNEITRDALDFYDTMFEDRELTLNVTLPENATILVGDKQLLGQAIVNLIDNAIKYTQKGGHINVSITTQPEKIILIVADNGPGIPGELREKAKERFYRLDKSRNTEGTGLGLNLVNAVAGLHLGSLTLENNQPGLRATLTFPVAPNANTPTESNTAPNAK